jgi:hypothetical protein
VHRGNVILGKCASRHPSLICADNKKPTRINQSRHRLHHTLQEHNTIGITKIALVVNDCSISI